MTRVLINKDVEKIILKKVFEAKKYLKINRTRTHAHTLTGTQTHNHVKRCLIRYHRLHRVEVDDTSNLCNLWQYLHKYLISN